MSYDLRENSWNGALDLIILAQTISLMRRSGGEEHVVLVNLENVNGLEERACTLITSWFVCQLCPIHGYIHNTHVDLCTV